MSERERESARETKHTSLMQMNWQQIPCCFDQFFAHHQIFAAIGTKIPPVLTNLAANLLPMAAKICMSEVCLGERERERGEREKE